MGTGRRNGGRETSSQRHHRAEFGGKGFCGSEQFENQAQKEGRDEQWGHEEDSVLGVWGFGGVLRQRMRLRDSRDRAQTQWSR